MPLKPLKAVANSVGSPSVKDFQSIFHLRDACGNFKKDINNFFHAFFNRLHGEYKIHLIQANCAAWIFWIRIFDEISSKIFRMVLNVLKMSWKNVQKFSTRPPFG